MNPEENMTGKEATASKLFVEKDVLGLDKPPVRTTRSNPKKIFIGLAVIIAIALVYWLVMHH